MCVFLFFCLYRTVEAAWPRLVPLQVCLSLYAGCIPQVGSTVSESLLEMWATLHWMKCYCLQASKDYLFNATASEKAGSACIAVLDLDLDAILAAEVDRQIVFWDCSSLGRGLHSGRFRLPASPAFTGQVSYATRADATGVASG